MVASLSTLAIASDSDELVKQGVALRRKGDDIAALQKFEQAYAMDKSPRILAQMALAEQALGRWALAYDHLTAAVDEKRDPWIAKHKDTLQDAMKELQEHVGKLEILGGSPGAEARINGAVVGTLPLAKPLTLPIGSAALELAAPRFIPVRRTTVVRAGLTTRESFDALVSAADAQIPGPEARVQSVNQSVTAGGASTSEVRPVDPTRGARPESQTTDHPEGAASEEPSTLRLSAKWVAGGLAVLGLAGGTIAYLRHKDAGDNFDQLCYADPATGVHPLAAAMTTEAHCRDLQSTWNSNYRLAIVGVAAGVALAAAGIVLWVTEPERNNGQATAFRCAPGPVGPREFTLGCALHF